MKNEKKSVIRRPFSVGKIFVLPNIQGVFYFRRPAIATVRAHKLSFYWLPEVFMRHQGCRKTSLRKQFISFKSPSQENGHPQNMPEPVQKYRKQIQTTGRDTTGFFSAITRSHHKESIPYLRSTLKKTLDCQPILLRTLFKDTDIPLLYTVTHGFRSKGTTEPHALLSNIFDL